MISNSDVLQMMEHKYALFGLFFAFHNRLQATGDTFYEEITCKQFFLMACMNIFKEEAPTMNDLSKVMGCSRQNVKQIVSSLEKKGFIELRVSETDKRKQQIYLTKKSFEMAEKYRIKETEFIERMFRGVTEEEVDVAYGIISKIEVNLKNMEDKNNEE